jgi:ABC-type phosphate transport system substrate-binding protein
MNFISLKIGVACTALLACVVQAVALDGVVLIANNSVTADSISAAALKDIYIGRTMYWQDGQSVIITVLAGDAAADKALNEVSGMDASQFKTFWQRMVFSGRGHQPNKADDVAALVSLVSQTKGAVALVPADAVLKGVKQIEVK